MSLSTAAITTLLDRGIGRGARRGGRDRIVGLELDHRPHDEAERGRGTLGELELRDQVLGSRPSPVL